MPSASDGSASSRSRGREIRAMDSFSGPAGTSMSLNDRRRPTSPALLWRPRSTAPSTVIRAETWCQVSAYTPVPAPSSAPKRDSAAAASDRSLSTAAGTPSRSVKRAARLVPTQEPTGDVRISPSRLTSPATPIPAARRSARLNPARASVSSMTTTTGPSSGAASVQLGRPEGPSATVRPARSVSRTRISAPLRSTPTTTPVSARNLDCLAGRPPASPCWTWSAAVSTRPSAVRSASAASTVGRDSRARAAVSATVARPRSRIAATQSAREPFTRFPSELATQRPPRSHRQDTTHGFHSSFLIA
ncbi:hypothetical protein GA0115252_150011 [Streptomyces sp. DfronAA-171]|nr:hypothetical protein GA0115252_150011 [Streptomyces sp. DfronAA-171]